MSQNLPLRTTGGRSSLVVIVLAVAIVALVIAGLLLPPISLASRLGLSTTGCKTLTTKNPSLSHPDGLSVAIDANSKSTLAIKLSSVSESRQSSLPQDLQTALKSLPKGYKAKGPVYQIAACGTRAVPSTLNVLIPDGAEPWETVDLLTWDGKAWQWIGGQLDADTGTLSARVKQVPQNVIVAQTSAPTAVIASDLPASGDASPEGMGLATMVFVPGLMPDVDGGLLGDPDALPKPPEGVTVAQYPALRNWGKPGRANPALVADVLANAQVRATHIKALTNLVTKSRYAGVQIDYRGLGEEDREAFTAFVQQLNDALDKVNKKLVVVVPTPIPQGDGTWDTQAYDLAALGAAADAVQVELPLDPAALGKATTESLVRWIMGATNRNKLYLGVTSLSVDQAGTDVALVTLDQAWKSFGSVKAPEGAITPGSTVQLALSGAQNVTFDPSTKSYRFTYAASNGQTRAVTLGSANALASKLNWALRYNIRGVTIHGLLDAGNDPNVFAVVQQYSAQSPASAPAPQVAWTVQGTPVATVPLTQTSVAWTAPASAGALTLAASVGGQSRGQAQITVGAAVPTPAPVVTPVTTTTATSGASDCNPKVSYVADVTIPDNSKLDKNAAFTKTWRVKNSGTCDWPGDSVLAFISGRKLGAPDSVPVGTVKVGETKEISVNMTAPNEDVGSISAKWQLKTGGKTFAGDPLTLVIVVGTPPTPTPVPQTSQPSTAPVVAPSSGSTMYGIHAHWAAVYNDESGMAQTASQITDLGLGWTKHQVRWGEEDWFYDCSGNFGFDWNHTNQVINAARAQGQRVLFSVVTAPPCTNAMRDQHAPPDDPNVFAAFLGELASRYKGFNIGIEVWNEQNIDREWKSSPQKINPARYTQYLAAAYNKIKSIDPNILVVSGALAPTGCNDGVACMDDFEYLRQMKAAGADKYMDCVGTHANALRTPPDAGVGSEYDKLFDIPHHSWYFKDTVQGYQQIMGRQACITEFGVASQNGVGTIKGFEWAAGNTDQNQADWVTQGMALARQYGARLLILWNLDYGPLSGVNDNALYSFFTPQYFKRPVYGAVKGWCAANGCK